MYEARQVLLGLEGDPIDAEIPDTYFMRFGGNGNEADTRSAELSSINNLSSNAITNAFRDRVGILMICNKEEWTDCVEVAWK